MLRVIRFVRKTVSLPLRVASLAAVGAGTGAAGYVYYHTPTIPDWAKQSWSRMQELRQRGLDWSWSSQIQLPAIGVYTEKASGAWDAWKQRMAARADAVRNVFRRKADDEDGNGGSNEKGSENQQNSSNQGQGDGGSNHNGNKNGWAGPAAAAAATAAMAAPRSAWNDEYEKHNNNSLSRFEQDVHNSLDEGDDQLILVTRKLIEVRNILQSVNYENNIRLPAIVVIGSQSSGKSSVLEAIVGQEFLPKGNNMVTRRPLELTLIHTPNASGTYGIFPSQPHLLVGDGKSVASPDKPIHDFSLIQSTLAKLNGQVPDSDCVSDEPIFLHIYSSSIPDLTLIDLPGYIAVPSRNQPANLQASIAGLCDKFVREPNIILAVSAADVDLANSEALRAARRVDPSGRRTIGVITKLDLVDPELGARILRNKDYPLRLGYVGVVTKAPSSYDSSSSSSMAVTTTRNGRGQNQNEQQMHLQKIHSTSDSALDFQRLARMEMSFFKEHAAAYGNPESSSVGVGTLRRKLMEALENSMSKSLTRIVDAVRGELEEARYQFKVQYNDRNVSASSYVSEVMDATKRSFREFSKTFGKVEIRKLVREMLDQRVVDILRDVYWSDDVAVETLSRGSCSRLLNQMHEAMTSTSSSSSSSSSMFSSSSSSSSSSSPFSFLSSWSSSSSSSATSSSPSSSSSSLSPSSSSSSSSTAADDPHSMYWSHRLDYAASLLTQSGIGRATTQLVTDTLLERLEKLFSTEPFLHHPENRQKILQFCADIIRSKTPIAVDQVENTIKPYKIEVECTQAEWNDARNSAERLLLEEYRNVSERLRTIRNSVGNRRLREAMAYVDALDQHNDSFQRGAPLSNNERDNSAATIAKEQQQQQEQKTSKTSLFTSANWAWPFGKAKNSSPSSNLDKKESSIDNDDEEDEQVHDISEERKSVDSSSSSSSKSAAAAAGTMSSSPNVITPDRIVLESYYNPRNLEKAREAHELKKRSLLLRSRLDMLRYGGCQMSSDCAQLCPEVFLAAVAQKLTYTAVMFLQVELLNEFFFAFPREVDNRVYNKLDRAEMDKFARENPQYQHHLALQDRKRLFELANEKLTYLLQRQEEFGRRHR